MAIRKRKLNKSLVWFSVLFSVCLVIAPFGARAAILHLEPSSGEYHQGDTFITEIRIDTEGECINAVDINMGFPPDILEAVNFSKGDSILTFWVKPPTIDQNLGLISFAGGIPGGYCGVLPGDPREASVLGRIVFRARETDAKLERETDAKIKFLDTSQVLLNDGFGTPAKLTTRGAVFTILLEKAEFPKDEWLQKLEKDNIPPEPFEIEIHRDPAIFEGKYFIIFSTTDKQTGLGYFEVKEGKRDWKRAESPHLLEDQGLSSIIKVKAVDKAGNERIAEYLPPKEPFPWWLIVLIMVGGGVIWFIIKSRNRREILRETEAKL